MDWLRQNVWIHIERLCSTYDIANHIQTTTHEKQCLEDCYYDYSPSPASPQQEQEQHVPHQVLSSSATTTQNTNHHHADANNHVINVRQRRIQNYCVWRKSCLVISCPFILITFIFQCVDVSNLDMKHSIYNGWGKLLNVLVPMITSLLLIFVIISLYYWCDLYVSKRILRVGWMISFMYSLFFLSIPYDSFINQHYSLWWQVKMQRSMYLLPYVLTLSGSMIHVAIRMIWYLPQYSIYLSMTLLFVTMFHSMIIFLSFFAIINMIGNGLLYFSIILLCLTPYIYWFYYHNFMKCYHLFDDPLHYHRMKQVELLFMIMTVVGYVIVIIWGCTSQYLGIRPIGSNHNQPDELYIINYRQLFQLLFNSCGQFIITMVLLSDIMLQMIVIMWKEQNHKSHYERHQRQLCQETTASNQNNNDRNETKCNENNNESSNDDYLIIFDIILSKRPRTANPSTTMNDNIPVHSDDDNNNNDNNNNNNNNANDTIAKNNPDEAYIIQPPPPQQQPQQQQQSVPNNDETHNNTNSYIRGSQLEQEEKQQEVDIEMDEEQYQQSNYNNITKHVQKEQQPQQPPQPMFETIYDVNNDDTSNIYSPPIETMANETGVIHDHDNWYVNSSNSSKNNNNDDDVYTDDGLVYSVGAILRDYKETADGNDEQKHQPRI